MTSKEDEIRDLLNEIKQIREVSDSFLILAEGYVGKIPEDLEELDKLFEREFGPGLWKRIYDKIPNKLDEDRSTNEERPSQLDDDDDDEK